MRLLCLAAALSPATAMAQAPTNLPQPAAGAAAGATGDSQPLKVGVLRSPPFVIRDGDTFTGMAIDIWQDAAKEMGVDYVYTGFPNVRALIDATAAGEIDIAVSNISITKARAARVEFTQPWFDSGLRIMVNEDRGVGLRAVIEGLADAGFLRAYMWLILVIVIATIVLTVFDRSFNKSFPSRWRDGVAESFYSVMSVVTSGRMPSRPNLFGWMGRIMQAFWLICGIAVLAYITSSVTSVMTALSLNSHIQSLADLNDRNVGVPDGSTAEDFLRDRGIGVTEYDDIDALVQAVLAEEVDAVVDDAPVLEYFATTHPDEPLDVVGPLFNRDTYGFAMPIDNPLVAPLTLQLLGAIERGDVDTIRLRYFGDNR
ncbi:MAG: hypothetical protein AcusKO_31920 [Acuticoccus sp.]